jgi:IS605 OrfB family transposase
MDSHDDDCHDCHFALDLGEQKANNVASQSRVGDGSRSCFAPSATPGELHHLSKWLVASYDLIVFEKLNIPDMVEANFARSILDAAWGMLGKQLTYKAEEAGKRTIPVAPGFTAQICSGCGRLRKKPLSERVHRCSCGLVMSRDQNATINILRLGRSRGEISQESWSARN